MPDGALGGIALGAPSLGTVLLNHLQLSHGTVRGGDAMRVMKAWRGFVLRLRRCSLFPGREQPLLAFCVVLSPIHVALSPMHCAARS